MGELCDVRDLLIRTLLVKWSLSLITDRGLFSFIRKFTYKTLIRDQMSCVFVIIQVKAHPGTVVYNTDRFAGWSSLENAWHQVDEMGQDLMRICDQHPDGVNLLGEFSHKIPISNILFTSIQSGYSQGALISRAILETFANHSVHNFISLSGPQAGQYGSKFI